MKKYESGNYSFLEVNGKRGKRVQCRKNGKLCKHADVSASAWRALMDKGPTKYMRDFAAEHAGTERGSSKSSNSSNRSSGGTAASFVHGPYTFTETSRGTVQTRKNGKLCKNGEVSGSAWRACQKNAPTAKMRDYAEQHSSGPSSSTKSRSSSKSTTTPFSDAVPDYMWGGIFN